MKLPDFLEIWISNLLADVAMLLDKAARWFWLRSYGFSRYAKAKEIERLKRIVTEIRQREGSESPF